MKKVVAWIILVAIWLLSTWHILSVRDGEHVVGGDGGFSVLVFAAASAVFMFGVATLALAILGGAYWLLDTAFGDK